MMKSTLSIFTHFANPAMAQAQFNDADTLNANGVVNQIPYAHYPQQQPPVQEMPQFQQTTESYPQQQQQEQNQINYPPQYYPNSIYDASRLAMLNGEMPPYDPSYPSSEKGYLVPVWVDDISDIPTASNYDWLDPNTDTSLWASYGVNPEQISDLTNPEKVSLGNDQ